MPLAGNQRCISFDNESNQMLHSRGTQCAYWMMNDIVSDAGRDGGEFICPTIGGAGWYLLC